MDLQAGLEKTLSSLGHAYEHPFDDMSLSKIIIFLIAFHHTRSVLWSWCGRRQSPMSFASPFVPGAFTPPRLLFKASLPNDLFLYQVVALHSPDHLYIYRHHMGLEYNAGFTKVIWCFIVDITWIRVLVMLEVLLDKNFVPVIVSIVVSLRHS